MTKNSIIVHLDCSSKLPQTEWLKQKTFISHNSEVWEVLDRGIGRLRVW